MCSKLSYYQFKRDHYIHQMLYVNLRVTLKKSLNFSDRFSTASACPEGGIN